MFVLKKKVASRLALQEDDVTYQEQRYSNAVCILTSLP